MNEILQDIVQNRLNGSQKNVLIHISKHQKLLADSKKNDVWDVAGHINSCLGSSKARLEGLVWLHELLQQSDTDLFTQHAVTWCRLLLQILQSHASEETMGLTCTIFGCLLRETSAFPEISREVSSSVLSQLITSLLSMQNKAAVGALSCLCCCMQYYPGGCGAHKNKIEKYAVSLLEENDETIANLASRCFALAARCGGGGSLGVKHTEAWGLQMDKVVGSLHSIISDLYMDCEADPPTSTKTESLMLSPVPDTEPEKTISLAAKLKVTLTCAMGLFREEFQATVKVPLEELLSVICRISAVTPKMLGSAPSTEKKYLSGLLPGLHLKTFQFLEVLISSCGGHMIPYCGLINQLFTQTLQWTQAKNHGYGKEKPYSALRQQVYITMQAWLGGLGAATNLETAASQLTKELLTDITVIADTVKLDSTKGKKSLDVRAPPKKKKKGGLFAEAGQLSSQRKLDQRANVGLCAAALKVLQLLFAKCGCLFGPKLHKELSEVLIPQVLQLQQASGGRLPIPYGAAICRQELYQLLLQLVVSPHPNWPSPMACVVGIMRAGQGDHDHRVASLCSQAMLTLENLLHPRVPSLACPLPIWQPGGERGQSTGSLLEQGQGDAQGNQSQFGIYGESLPFQHHNGTSSVQKEKGEYPHGKRAIDKSDDEENVERQPKKRRHSAEEVDAENKSDKAKADSDVTADTKGSISTGNDKSGVIPKHSAGAIKEHQPPNAGTDQSEDTMETSREEEGGMETSDEDKGTMETSDEEKGSMDTGNEEEEMGEDEQGTSSAGPSTSGFSVEVSVDADDEDEEDGNDEMEDAGKEKSGAKEAEHAKQLAKMMADFVDADPDSESNSDSD